MAWQYLAYLAFIFAGTLALQRVFHVTLGPPDQLAKTLAIVAALFVTWDAWAVSQGQWSFNPAFFIGLYIGNQPIEEIGFFFAVPLFYLTAWQIGKTRLGKKDEENGVPSR